MKYVAYFLIVSTIAFVPFGQRSVNTEHNTDVNSQEHLLPTTDSDDSRQSDRSTAIKPGTNDALLVASEDSVRGCCVWLTPEPKCTISHRAYCVQKAQQAGINYEFYDGTQCKDIPVCRQ